MTKGSNLINNKDFIGGKADLHTHSIHSDGSLTPHEIVEIANQRNLKAISITDHDNIDANDVAKELCQQYGIEFIPGVEISAQYGQYEIHLLGYFINLQSDKLIEYLSFFQEERRKRVFRILEKLQEHGIKIDPEYVMKNSKPGSIGRPHIADAMVELGFVRNYQKAFDKYLGDNCSCFVSKYKIMPGEAIDIIDQAGGISFIAHPGIDINNEGLVRLFHLGLEGIETVHPRHTPSQVAYYRDMIDKYDLLECGGSDCHGNRKKELMLGKLTIPYLLVEKMKKRLREKSCLRKPKIN